MGKRKTFPCWVCKGRGGEYEYFGDAGTKFDECYWCDGGQIEINSEKHVRLSLAAMATIGVVYKFASEPVFDEETQEVIVDETERELTDAVMADLDRLWRYQCGLSAPYPEENP